MWNVHNRQEWQPTGWKLAFHSEFGSAIKIVVRRALRRPCPNSLLDCRIRRLAYELFPNRNPRLREHDTELNVVVEQVSSHICQAILQSKRPARSTEMCKSDTIQQALDLHL